MFISNQQANGCVQHLGIKAQGQGEDLAKLKPVLNRGLQDKLSCVVQRLAKLRTGFDGRTESL